MTVIVRKMRGSNIEGAVRLFIGDLDAWVKQNLLARSYHGQVENAPVA